MQCDQSQWRCWTVFATKHLEVMASTVLSPVLRMMACLYVDSLEVHGRGVGRRSVLVATPGFVLGKRQVPCT
jgi:hypothetical protein